MANCYKLRLPIALFLQVKWRISVVYYYYNGESNLYLLTMFSKRDIENISDKIILELLKKYGLE